MEVYSGSKNHRLQLLNLKISYNIRRSGIGAYLF